MIYNIRLLLYLLCYILGIDLTYVDPPVACSYYYDAEGNKHGAYDIDTGTVLNILGEDSFVCKAGQVCVQSVSHQPGWTFINYNNIFYTMLNVFTVISTEGWTDLMYLSQDSISGNVASIFYCSCIYLMTYIMVPLFIAVITTSFSHVRGDMRSSAFAGSKKRTRLLLSRTIDNSHSTEEQQEQQQQQQLHQEEEWVYGHSSNPRERLLQKSHRLRRAISAVVSNPIFPYAGSALVAINAVFMMLHSPTLAPTRTDKLGKMEKEIVQDLV